LAPIIDQIIIGAAL